KCLPSVTMASCDALHIMRIVNHLALSCMLVRCLEMYVVFISATTSIYGARTALIDKRKVTHVHGVERIVLPPLDPGADQVLGDIEVDWDHRQFLEQNPLSLFQQGGALAGVTGERSFVHQPVVFRIGETRVVLLLGRGLRQKQITLGVVVIHDPSDASHLE